MSVQYRHLSPSQLDGPSSAGLVSKMMLHSQVVVSMPWIWMLMKPTMKMNLI